MIQKKPVKFTIITHVPHGRIDGQFFAYAPYVREMNIWTKFADAVQIVAPVELNQKTAIHIDYEFPNIGFSAIKSMDLLGFKGVLRTFMHTPKTAVVIFKAMQQSTHIHLRCPGNIGLLGCLIQILFPRKIKTAKYAGNWDPKATQPFTYRLQKWILNNTFLTKNMTVLVYGQWGGASKNIMPFFTATYHDSDKKAVAARSLSEPVRFLFAGTLSPGKRPLYAIEIIKKLSEKGYDVSLDFFGEGSELPMLQAFCNESHLNKRIHFHGNQQEKTVRKAYTESHFLILPSKSEGWPKVVAESMFWGCFPISSAVSCVPFMLDHGDRGLLLYMNIEQDIAQIEELLQNQAVYNHKVAACIDWSRKYTLDLFENQIKALVQQ